MSSKHLNGTVLEALVWQEKKDCLFKQGSHPGGEGRQKATSKQRIGLKGIKTVMKNCRIRCRVMGLKPPVLDYGKEGPSDKVNLSRF